MFDKLLIAAVIEAMSELLDEAAPLLDFTKKESTPTIAGEMATLKIGLDIS